ncbi:MAG: MarR family transcriptional regulator [Pseudomonadota bacterium]
MTDSPRIAHELDRVMRKIDAQMHKRMPSVDTGRVGPMASLLLMELEDSAPCSIQALANAMGRDNSQLTRLIRDLEGKGLLTRNRSPKDGRETILNLTPEGEAFLQSAKDMLTEVVDEVLGDLGAQDRQVLLSLLSRM